MATVVKRPSGKWQATVRSDGRSRSRTFMMRADAVRWARDAQVKAELDGGGIAASAPVGTLGDALTRFRDEVSARRTHGDVERVRLDALARHRMARVRLDRLTAADVAQWRDERLRKVKPGTVAREMALLRTAVGHAVGTGRVNVVAQVQKPRVDDRRERRLRDGEWQALLDAAHTCRNALMPAVLVLALETAMRRSELLSMRWCDVDMARCTVTLPRTKNGHARTVPLSPVAVATLATLPRTDARCLPMSANAVRLSWERVRARAGVRDLHLHDLRHEAISRLVERGWSLAQVQMVSGHRDLSMLMRYTHLAVADIVAKLHADVHADAQVHAQAWAAE